MSVGICVSQVGEHITKDMFFPRRGTHITKDMFSQVGEHISLRICFRR